MSNGTEGIERLTFSSPRTLETVLFISVALFILVTAGFWIHGVFPAEASESFDRDQAAIASASDTANLEVATPRDVSRSDLATTLQGHDAEITDLAFSPDGARLASSSLDGTIRIWDTIDGALLRTIAGHSAGIRSIDFSPDGTLLASGSDDRTAKLWNVSDGSLERTLFPLMESRVVEVKFSPDGSLVAMGGNRCVVELRRVPTGILRRTIVPLGCAPGNGGSVEFWGLEFTQDGSRVLTGDGRPCCGGGILQWWESGEYTPPKVLKTGIVVVRDMALSPDGSEIALALVGLSNIWLLDAAKGETKAVLPDHAFRVNDVEYSADGSLMASASNDTGVGLWRAADGVLLRMLQEHRMQATTVAFSPDGLSLASGSQDGELLTWNVEKALSR